MEFQIGDVVMLNSGGPKMTVFFVGDVDFGHSKVRIVQCKWFEQGRFNTEDFEPELLEKVER